MQSAVRLLVTLLSTALPRLRYLGVMAPIDPNSQRGFALQVVQRLRAAGYEAWWAGGCVRDHLLGLIPKDYDVATSARPDEIRALFGKRRTIAIGAAFGVITVLGPPGAGQIEVATFRRDAAYHDGRHPEHVTFSSAEEDASRRDFTINGLFFDPIAARVIDYVGGRQDLQRRLVRAIGNPFERFKEDKLRLLRAVRFAATFDFVLDPETASAIRDMAAEVLVVSPERIAGEMRRMLVNRHRVRAVRLLLETGLSAAILPEVVPHSDVERARLEHCLAVLENLVEPGFPLALAALLHGRVGSAQAEEIARRWRLSSKEISRVAWLVEHYAELDRARLRPWSEIQAFFVADGINDLLALLDARTHTGAVNPEEVAWCRRQRARPEHELNPAPLINGDDLQNHGIPRGPVYRKLLERVRAAQLDRIIDSREAALALVDRIVREETSHG